MNRTMGPALLMMAGLLTTAPSLVAQAATGPGSPKLVATWTGTYTTDGPSGPMTLAITKNETGWKVEPALEAAPPPGAIRDVAADGDKISWKQMFGEYDVTFVAKLSPDGTQLAGTIEAFQSGTAAGGGTFTLTKK